MRGEGFREDDRPDGLDDGQKDLLLALPVRDKEGVGQAAEHAADGLRPLVGDEQVDVIHAAQPER